MNLPNWKFLAHLLPASRRPEEVLTPEKRLQLFSTVTEHDNCLNAVLSQMQETLATEFHVAISTAHNPEQRLRACEGMRLAYHAMQNIEKERAEAHAWRRERETQRPA